MRIVSKFILSFALLCIACAVSNRAAEAQTIYFGVHDIALKNGESAELAQVYYIGANCKSLLKGVPAVEILDGPPGVTAAIKEENVVPRGLGCAKPVPGGKLVVTAKDILDYSRTRMVLRVSFKTQLGDRQFSRDINISLFP